MPQLVFCSITNHLRTLMAKIITISCSYINTMEYYSGMKMNTFQLVLMRWMNLEPIIQSDKSQKEKNKCHILIGIYMESRKMVLMNLFVGQQWRCRHREEIRGHGRRGGKEGEDETNGVSSNIHYHM